MKLEHGTPMDIEGESMRIIQSELDAMGIALPPDCAAVVKRAIHTTADFDYAGNLRFTSGAVEAGVTALKAGTPIVTDTNMARSGINQTACGKLGVERLCYMAEPAVARRARELGHPTANGLGMLVYQAVFALEHFTDTTIDAAAMAEVLRNVLT